MVTPLCKEWVDAEVRRSVEQWLGRPQNEDGRLAANEAAIFICAACGDLDCGAIVMQVGFSPTTVTWSRFRWVGVGNPEPDDHIDVFGPGFVFELQEYEATLEAAPDRVESLAGERPQPRRAQRSSWWRPGQALTVTT